jgi:hypothetical protein
VYLNNKEANLKLTMALQLKVEDDFSRVGIVRWLWPALVAGFPPFPSV